VWLPACAQHVRRAATSEGDAPGVRPLRRRRVWKHTRIRAAKWLIERAPAGELEAVVSSLCGIHARVATAAELSISARVEGLTRAQRAELDTEAERIGAFLGLERRLAIS
jgi:hypothetical protein